MSIFDLFRRKKTIKAPWSKYYTKEELGLKIPNITIYEQLLEAHNKTPDNIAIKYFNKKITFKKLMKEIDRASISFKKLNINRGDIVTICLPNFPEALVALYALNKIGALANMLHPLSAPEEIKNSLNSTNSRLLIMADTFYNKIEKNIYETNIEKVIFVNPSNSMGIFMKIGYKIMNIKKFKKYPKNKLFISYKQFMRLFTDEEVKMVHGKNNPAVILHSGGTSGTPKNIVIQNRAFVLASIQQKIALKRLKTGDSCLTIMPNFHGFGLSVTMHTPLSLGCTVILIPIFDAKKIDLLFNKYNPECVLGVPTLFEALASSNNKDIDLSNLKYIISGGDALSKSLEDRVNEYLMKHNCTTKISQGYGLSEALAAVTLARDEINKSGSVGIPFPTNYIKIIDSGTRKEKETNEIGEICINSKALMMGYLNNETETNEALQVHDDGHVWLHTGDLGYMDEDGFLFYKGRQKRMIISSGYNIYPSHIEEVIEKHPAVLQCTVVGIPHPYKQEVPKAFIVLKEGHRNLFTKLAIKDYCKQNLSKYMIPHEFVYRKNLPKTKLGKVDFVKLKNDFNEDDD